MGVYMSSIYSITKKDLENYFIDLGEKNSKQHKFMNGYIEKE